MHGLPAGGKELFQGGYLVHWTGTDWVEKPNTTEQQGFVLAFQAFLDSDESFLVRLNRFVADW